MKRNNKPWYKKWWGVIVAILALPYFLLWFVWAKTAWGRRAKVGATVALVVLCILDLVWFTNWPSNQPTQPVASRTRISTQQTQPASSNTTTTACQKPSTSVSAQSEYANANQIIQVLTTHNVPCSNVVKDTGISSFTGATSGVWAETAPGDIAAQFGGTENTGTDTEIVVFQNHADAVAYTNIGNGTDTNHEMILGTNYAIDAAAPTAASIRAALGVTSPSSAPTPKPTPKPTATPAHTVTYQFTLMSGHLSANDIQNVGIAWHNPSNGQDTQPSDLAGAIQQISRGGYSVTIHVSKINNNNIWDSVNNYSDPDASIACTILVDGNVVANEIAPTSGYADCSANGIDNQSGH